VTEKEIDLGLAAFDEALSIADQEVEA